MSGTGKEERFIDNPVLLEAGMLLSGAAAWDMFTHKIPNKWLLFWIFPAMIRGPENGVIFLAYAGAGAAVTFFLFYFRMIGAGDCKLMALICGYLGIRQGCLVIAAGFVIGAVWSLEKLVFEKQLMERRAYLAAWFRQIIYTGKKAPYYQPQKAGYKATVPLAACMLGGFLAAVLLGAVK